jgi:hypothetical protein
MCFWYGSLAAKSNGSAAASSIYTYPSPYDSSYSRSLVFAGFSWQISGKNISFAVAILPGGTTTSETIQFKVLQDLLVYFISFEILLISSASG